ncbi:deoxyribonuclease-1-like [Argiope bruennichi]|uniref:deoxyribonuclease-1-like n=1 Tax=Argiope bruennichi TaxID=94029 RepID=UPI0024941D3F|nr:deoxyribonuclease-1-like [Argiope bruennichi]
MKRLEYILSACTFLLAIQSSFPRHVPLQTENEIGYLKTPGRARSNSYWKTKDNAVEPPLLIGSFNIQTLSKRKLRNGMLMPTIEKIVHRYDLILILELMTNDPKLMEKFVQDVNDYAPEGVKYNMTVSIDPHVNEYIAIFYRTDKLRMLKSESYYDPEKFYRKPFFLLFDSPTLRDMKRFGLIGYHVKPSQAVREIDALADVYDFMKDKYDIEDILIMGDFNADCDYVKEQNWDSISLWTRHEFTWAIPRTEDTTTNYRSCALDRIVYAGENMNSGVILSSAGAFDYRYEFDVTMEEARSISDHWPVEVKIRGKMSKLAEKHLTSDVCFTIHDSRKPNITKDRILKACQVAQFKPMSTPSGFSLRNETREFVHMLAAISRLRNALPEAITNEQSEAILFKANNGGLNDESSYADSQHVVFKVVVSILNSSSEILVCRTTTVN